MALVLGLFGLVPPFLTKLLIDLVYPTGDVDLLQVLVLAGLSLALAGAILGALRSFYTTYVDSRLSSATRLLFFNHLQHLPPRFFHQNQVGEINSRFQDVAMALRTLSDLFRTVFVQGIYLLLVPPVLFWLEWRLAILALLSVPLVTGLTALSGSKLRPHWRRTSEALADINAFQVETLSHIETFKTLGREHEVFERARGKIEEALEHQLRTQSLSEGFNAANTTVKALNLALFTWFGWMLILDGAMTLGGFVAFTSYVNLLYGPVAQLIRLFGQVQQSSIHLGRMFEYLDLDPEMDPVAAWEPPPPVVHTLEGGYELRGVGFAYDPKRPVLDGLDLDLPAGSTTAIVGASGSGKTTLLRLLCGLERPGRGTLEIDGRTVDEVGVSDLRRQVAVVWQDPGLIRGSLWDNLTLGIPGGARLLSEPEQEGASKGARFLSEPRPRGTSEGARLLSERVDEVVSLCGLEEVVEALPDGYASPVAEWGASLSAGQRQRVALARAVLRDTPIVLFDEATSNLDVGTEATLLDRILDRLADRTVVFVTHRLAVARRAERVAVLDAGRLVGLGHHSELLDSCEAYARMHHLDAGESAR